MKTCLYNSYTNDHPALFTSQSVRHWEHKWNVVPPCNKMLLCNKKRWIKNKKKWINRNDACHNIDDHCVNEASHKRPDIIWFYSFEISRISKSTRRKRISNSLGLRAGLRDSAIDCA